MSTDTDVVYFYEGMVEAPQHSGQVGVAKDLLYTFLVTGFHTKTITSLTRTGTVATAVCSAHGYEANRIIEIAGVNEAGWNDRYRITSTQSGSFTFTVPDTLTTPCTGTILAKYAPARWSRLDDGSNVSAFRQGVSSGYYYRVDDSNAKYLKLRGYRDMADRNNGSDPFPASGDYFLAKSDAASSSTRKYFFMADQEQFIFFVEHLPGTYPGVYGFSSAGSAITFLNGDTCHRFLIGASADGSSQIPNAYCPIISINGGDSATGQIFAKSFDQQTGPVAFLKYGLYTGSSTMGGAGLIYPAMADLGGRAVKILMVESALNSDRGILPGCFQPPSNLNAAAVATGAIWIDVAGYEGKEVMVIKIYNNSYILINRTGPWR